MTTPAPHPVFISYARNTSRAHAEALHQALGGADGLAFLDTSDLEAGDHWPTTLRDSLLAARLVVIFAEEGYFRRPYCCRELRAALAPFFAAQERPGRSEARGSEALEALVVALPVVGPSGMEYLPPLLRDTQWPRADDTAGLVALIRSRLDTAGVSLGERLAALGASLHRMELQMMEELALHPPSHLDARQRLHPVQLQPSLGSDFIGRAYEVWWIDFMLRAQQSLGHPRIAALQGGGGSGKTRIALEYLHRYGRHYPGGVFWINAEVGEERLEAQLHGVLRTLRPDTPDLLLFRKLRRSASDELARALREVSAEQPILYIVDNLPEPQGTQPPRPLRDWCPGLGQVALLVTSRLRITEAGVHSLLIEPLAPESARVMLTRNVMGQALDEQDWNTITRWVGHLPLALELLNSALQLKAIGPRELLDKALHARPTPALDRQMDALRAHVPPASLRGITEAFSISYNRLDERARKAARLISWLAPEPIPTELLEALGPEASAPHLRASLVARSFVTPFPEGDIPLFGRMHRLLADFLRSQSPELAVELLHTSRAVLEMVPPAACRDSAAWPMLQLWFPHAEAVHASLRQRSAPLDASLEANLGMLMGYYLAERGALSQARQLGEDVLLRVRAASGPEHPDTLAAVNNLALIRRELGDNASAISDGERLLEVSRRVGDERGTLTAMGNLAAALEDEGFIERAREMKEEVLERRLKTLGPKHPETLTAMNNLAQSLAEAGEREEAFALQEQCFRLSLEVLGPDHPDTLLAMSNFAGGLHALGHLEDAQELQERALAAFLESHGPHHAKSLVMRSELAGILLARGDSEGARRQQEQVLAVRSRESGVDHPSTLAAMRNLATILAEGGELQRACELLRDALERCRRVFGENHRETHFVSSHLSMLLGRLGAKADARALLEAQLRSLQRQLGEDHPGTLGTLCQLAAFHHSQGELPRARELGQRALEAWVRTCGNEELETTLAAWSLLRVLRELGDSEACQTLLARHLQWMFEREPATLHPLQRDIRTALMQELEVPEQKPASDEELEGSLEQQLEALMTDPVRHADLLLHVTGTPVESDEAYEQIRSFLLGKLLSRGIKKGEAAAVVERGRKEYRVQLLLRREHGPEQLGSISVPLEGHGSRAFDAALKKAGITELDELSLRVVTKRSVDSREG